MTTEEGKSRYITPTTQPISILPTDISNTFTHIHPTLLLSYYYFRFPSLVADPVSTLSFDLLLLAAWQLTYAILCLPAHKSANPAQPVSKESKASLRKKQSPAKGNGGLSNKLVPALLALTLTAFPSAIVLTIALILFGAPLTTHHPQTLLCAAHICLLAFFPLFYVHGVASRTWREVGGIMLPFDEVWGSTVFTILGAWLGAIPIPLDWDRDWQTWPITIVTGAYLGWALGKYAGKYLLSGKRIQFD